MPAPTRPVTIVNVGYRSTNFWVVSAGKSRLLVDLGWPGMIGQLKQQLARMDVPISELRYGVATHYHIDHAGCAQDLKALGMKLLVVDLQQASIPRMKDHIKPQDHYTDITLNDNTVISIDESRAFLASIGIDGQILHTPGHSDDSVSLLLDNGAVFTGDLTHPMLVGDDDAAAVNASWDLLKAHGATTVYPGHGAPRRI